MGLLSGVIGKAFGASPETMRDIGDFAQRLAAMYTPGGNLQSVIQMQRQGRRQDLQDEYTKQLQDMQMQQYQQALQDAATAREEKQAIKGAYKKALATKVSGGLTSQGLLSGDFMPEYKSEMPSQKEIQSRLYSELSQISPEQALQFMPQAPKVKQYMEIAGQQGEKLYQGVDEYGQPVGGPMNAYMQPVQVNTGGSVRFEVPRAGLNIPVGMSPAESARIGLERDRFKWQKDQSGASRPTWDAARGQFIYAPTAEAPTGRAVAPAGISATTKPATEGERTAAGYLGRMQASENVLSSPDAKAPWLANALPFVTPGTLKANLLNSEAQQQYEQAQMDWVRAKLRKESGAVIGEDEMAAEIRTYFPMPGDAPAKIAQKARARKQAEQQMMSSAGGAYQPSQNTNAPMRGQVVDGYKYKGGDPADQNNWERQ